MISVLLPVYNGSKYIEKSIHSILSQSFKDFEILVGFNGTTDNSKELVSSINDDRIRIFDYSHKGKSKTLNMLLKESKYNWIALQDDDDIWLPNKLESQIKFVNNYDVIGTQIYYCDEYGNILDNSPNLSKDDSSIKKISLSGNNQIANSSALINKSVLNSISGWDESLPGLEDFDIWIRLIKIGCKFINVDERLTLHRLHQSSNFNNMGLDNHNKLLQHVMYKNI